MEGHKGYKKGLWTEEEDRILMEHIRVHGKGRWNRMAKMTGLKRCGKSCRLRWINYLSPSIKHGDFSEEEDDLIIRLHNLLGNRWSLIAGRVPGRTDNQVKNHWNTHLSKKLGLINKKPRFTNKSSAAADYSSSSSPTLLVSNPESVAAPKDNVDSSLTPPNLRSEGNIVNKVEGIGEEEEGQSKFGRFLDEVEEINPAFWFSNNLINPPSLVDMLDQFSPDFVWHGL